MTQSIPAVLTVEEFAERMQVSRTTVFDWIKKGVLKAGRHYIQIGRVIRFEWSCELLQKLREDSTEPEQVLPLTKPMMGEIKKVKRARNNNSAMNFDY